MYALNDPNLRRMLNEYKRLEAEKKGYYNAFSL